MTIFYDTKAENKTVKCQITVTVLEFGHTVEAMFVFIHEAVYRLSVTGYLTALGILTR